MLEMPGGRRSLGRIPLLLANAQNVGSAFFAAGVPPLCAFLPFNTAGVTIVENARRSLSFSVPATASATMLVWAKGAPAPPYRVAMHFDVKDTDFNNNIGMGMTYRDGATGKLQAFYYRVNTNWTYAVDNWPSPTSNPSSLVSGGADNSYNIPRSFALYDDGLTVHYQLSTSGGAPWIDFGSALKSSGYLGATGYNQVGFVLINANAGSSKTVRGTIHNWDEKALFRPAMPHA